ncbi:hypothetical protein [Pseudanabaena sp. Chao 1811]|uniref:hypothetical protein n=1 Tax=Pseudanabaena sp. Chao 1811 TaxID=2963092 RepID=UPI0022F3A841|nr:hypothetical protein [Pseudanabaena sp. Chao 1811]
MNDLLFPHHQTAIAPSSPANPIAFSLKSNSDRPLITRKPDRLSMLLFYNEISYIVLCNDTK